jgi:hypothetical protein
MKSVCLKKFKFHAWVKKCHFGNFTRNWLIGWIGHALLVQPSKTVHLYFNLHLFFLNMKPLSKVAPGVFSFGHSDLDPSSVTRDTSPPDLCIMTLVTTYKAVIQNDISPSEYW